MDSKILEQLKEMSAEVQAEEERLFGSPQQNDLSRSAKYQELTRILHDNPILVEPALRWLKATQAKLAAATLNVLYTPEELEELQQRIA
jgi:hypothetical protein